MAHAGRLIGRVLLVAVPAVLGIAAILLADQLKTPPAPAAVARQPVVVRTLTVEPMALIARVSGFGAVTPARDWRAVARIEGEVTEVASALAPGNILREGTALFRIDDSDLKLSLAGVDAQLAASEIRDKTIQASLEIATADLALAEEEQARQEQLREQGVATQTVLDASRRQTLVARSKVTDLSNQILLNAAERDVLHSQRASLARALTFATITAPFDMRVTSVQAEAGQYVSRGQVLLSGEGIEAAEIAAQFPMGRIGPLLRLMGEGSRITDLKARVRLPGADHTVVWPAMVDRMGDAIDERTQNAPLVVRVEDPQSQTVAGQRPPLRRNMIVEVELSAPRLVALVVPAEAIQNGTALVVSDDGTLQKRGVQLAFVSGEIAVVSSGLEVGDQLVITDPSIAVPGMAVKAVDDADRKAAITALAAGELPKAKGGAGAGKAGKAQP